MPKQFIVRKAEMFNKPYLKIELFDKKQLQDIKELVESLHMVHRCNITHNHEDDLTVYVDKFYTIDETLPELCKLLRAHFGTGLLSSDTKSLVQDAERNLKPYQAAYSLYSQAINNLQTKHNYRHAMDDLRLSLELLLKEILSNDKSLNNQTNDLREYLGRKGKSTEIIGVANNDMQALARYFDKHVKHNNDVKTNEIDYITYLTSNIVHLLLS